MSLGAGLACLQSRPFTSLTHLVHHAKYNKKDPGPIYGLLLKEQGMSEMGCWHHIQLNLLSFNEKVKCDQHSIFLMFNIVTKTLICEIGSHCMMFFKLVWACLHPTGLEYDAENKALCSTLTVVTPALLYSAQCCCQVIPALVVFFFSGTKEMCSILY